MAVSRLSQQSIQQAFPKGNTVWDGTTSTASMDSLGSVLLNSATNSITFSNIPQTYQHLVIRGVYLGSATNDDVRVQVNGITSSVYAIHGLYGIGNASTPLVTQGSSATFFYLTTNAGDGTNPASSVCEILDYTNTSKYKVARIISGLDRNGSGQIQFFSGSYQQTTAISSLRIHTPVGNMNAGTRYSLYGVK